jgi:hypothetical protein
MCRVLFYPGIEPAVPPRKPPGEGDVPNRSLRAAVRNTEASSCCSIRAAVTSTDVSDRGCSGYLACLVEVVAGLAAESEAAAAELVDRRLTPGLQCRNRGTRPKIKPRCSEGKPGS